VYDSPLLWYLIVCWGVPAIISFVGLFLLYYPSMLRYVTLLFCVNIQAVFGFKMLANLPAVFGTKLVLILLDVDLSCNVHIYSLELNCFVIYIQSSFIQ